MSAPYAGTVITGNDAGTFADHSPLLLAGLGAASISASGVLIKLADTGPATAAFYRCLLALPLLIGLFIVATPGKHWPDLFRAPETGWMTLYWLALCTSASYLLIPILRLLWVVRRDPRSTVTANIYIAAITIDLGCLSSVVASRVIAGYPTAVTWTLLCVAACGYAIAPAYSWHIKTRTIPWRAPLT